MVATDLFFSEYVEGSSLNKALEIANFTGSSIDLSEYSIEIYFNGNTTAGTIIELTGTLADGEVFIVADDGAAPAILAVADLTSTSNFFNGDDALVLRKGGLSGMIIDSIGQIGVDPGSEWPGGGADETLRRLSTVISGDTNPNDAFDASVEWETFPQNTFEGLGSHLIDGGTATLPVINEVLGSTTGNDVEYIELFGQPGRSLDGLSIIVVEGDNGSPIGTIDARVDLGPEDVIGDNGFFLIGNSAILFASVYGVTPNQEISANFIENSSYTIALVDTSSLVGTSISGSEVVLDTVGVTDGGADDIFFFDAPVIGPDGSFLPAGVRRVTDGIDTDTVDDWVISDFFLGSANTPTAGTSDHSGGDPEPTLTSIYDIQGAAHTSPLLGASVTTSGIVTAVDTNGFYLQDAVGDGDIATSDAIFVFTGSAPGVSVGDELQVAGTVSEFTPGGTSTGNLSTTQISGNPAITVLSSGNALPAAVILGQGGRVPPSENIDDDAFGSFEPTTDGIDFFESLEGMRVTAQDLVAVAGTNRFGEIFAVVDRGNSASGISDRGTLNISPDDFNPERIQINEDAGIFNFDFPDVDTGALLGDVTGVIGYSFGNFEILPTADFTSNITPSSLTPETTTITGDEAQLTVASYNVLNLDPNDSDGDTDIADGRFAAIAQQIANNLNAPDVIGLQEIQDNTGSTNDGTVSAVETLQTLVDAIVAVGGPRYEFIDNTFITNNASGGQPGANIRTAFLYNPERVDLVANSIQTIGGQGAGEAFAGARLPLVADFVFNGQVVTVVNNHFSSKGGSAPILGLEQPFDERQEEVSVNGSLDERQAQSAAVQDFVSNLLANDPNAKVAVLGDLNEFEFVSPVTGLEAAGLTNLTNTLPEDERYSFIFQGNSQSLDHILVSNSLLDGAKFDIVHTNSEFAETDSRASDHDPLLAALTIEASQPPPPPLDRLNDYTLFSRELNGKEFVVNLIDDQPVYVVDGQAVADQVLNSFLAEAVMELNGSITRNGNLNEDTLEHFGSDRNPFVRQQGSDVVIGGAGVSGQFKADFDTASAADVFEAFAADLLGKDPQLTEFFEFRGGTNGGANRIQILANDEIIGLNADVRQGLATTDSLLFRWTGANAPGRPTVNNQDDFFEAMGVLFGGTQLKDGQVTGFGNQNQSKLSGDDLNQVDFGSRGISGKEVWEFDDQQAAQNFLNFFDSVVDAFASSF